MWLRARSPATLRPLPEGPGQLPECPVLVAQKIILQLAGRDIRHLTDVESRPHRPHEAVNRAPRQASRPLGRVSCVCPADLGERVWRTCHAYILILWLRSRPFSPLLGRSRSDVPSMYPGEVADWSWASLQILKTRARRATGDLLGLNELQGKLTDVIQAGQTFDDSQFRSPEGDVVAAVCCWH
jgi:hypothetical protein